MDKHVVTAENAPLIKSWLAERGGIAVWASINLSNPGASWTTPLHTRTGERMTRPTWQADSEPKRVITDPAEVAVTVPKEVRRFRVAVRLGKNGLLFKLTDAASAKVRKAVADAGEDAWYEFDYERQEAVIYQPERTVPLLEFTREPAHAG